MKPNSLVLITALIAALHMRAEANDIIHATGFESPAFNPVLPLHGQDGFLSFTGIPELATTVSRENPRDGEQCLRWKGATY